MHNKVKQLAGTQPQMMVRFAKYLTPGLFYSEKHFPEKNTVQIYSFQLANPRVILSDGKEITVMDKVTRLFDTVGWTSLEQAKELKQVIADQLKGTKHELEF